MRTSICALLLCVACAAKRPAAVTQDMQFHQDAVVIDTHAETIEAMFYENYDLLLPHADRHLDLPRMMEGGLDAEFFSVFVHPESVDLTQFFAIGMKQVDLLQQTATNSGGRIAFARSAAEIRDNAGKGVISMLLAVEGGHMLLPGNDDEQLAHLRAYADRGVRSLTLAWSSSSPIRATPATPCWKRWRATAGRRASASRAPSSTPIFARRRRRCCRGPRRCTTRKRSSCTSARGCPTCRSRRSPSTSSTWPRWPASITSAWAATSTGRR